MKGYKIINGSPEECETQLNTLRNDYVFEVLQFSMTDTSTSVLIDISETIKKRQERIDIAVNAIDDVFNNINKVYHEHSYKPNKSKFQQRLEDAANRNKEK